MTYKDYELIDFFKNDNKIIMKCICVIMQL
jgi:hypothetical protein